MKKLKTIGLVGLFLLMLATASSGIFARYENHLKRQGSGPYQKI